MAPDDLFALTGRRLLITGGSRGIGAACAELAARQGAHVVIGYRARRDDAEAVVARCRAAGVTAAAHAADVATVAGAEALVATAIASLGGLDAVVVNAGIWPAQDVAVAAMDDARWVRTMRENVDAMFFTARAAARALADGGRVVLVSSTAGQRGEAFHADYAASKGAMISFTKSLAIELAPRGITVNSVAPGWVDTEMAAPAFGGDARARIAAAIPVGRIATPADVAAPVLFLCTPGARHITGEIVNVNGGSVLCG
jgi:3-oxoacyl-[acyl-carrier protein] reductase